MSKMRLHAAYTATRFVRNFTSIVGDRLRIQKLRFQRALVALLAGFPTALPKGRKPMLGAEHLPNF